MKTDLSLAIDKLFEIYEQSNELLYNKLNSFVITIENNPYHKTKIYFDGDMEDLKNYIDEYCAFLKEAVNNVYCTYIEGD